MVHPEGLRWGCRGKARSRAQGPWQQGQLGQLGEAVAEAAGRAAAAAAATVGIVAWGVLESDDDPAPVEKPGQSHVG